MCNYLILAMKRSGMHCFSNWIQAHTKQEFYNNTCFGWEDKKLLTMRGKKEAVEGIANIEDFNPASWSKYDFPSFPFLKNCVTIVFARTLDNWLASCYARKFSVNEEHQDVYKYLNRPYINDSKHNSPSRIDLYCEHLRLSDQCENKIGYVAIAFDDFIKSKRYRKYTAERLGIEWDEKADESIITPSKYGGGSSFNSISALDNDVFNRQKVFENDPEFQDIKRLAVKKVYKVMKEMGKL